MSDSYSKNESDLKMENLFSQFSAEMEKNDKQTKLLFQGLMGEFQKVEKDIDWLTKITMTTFGLILSILLAAAIKVIFHW